MAITKEFDLGAERIGEARVSVYNELDPLRELIMWGEPSCEALLGQLLPMNVSLFFSKYNVLEARNEFGRMQKMIEDHDVKTIRFKDVYAEILMKKPAALDLPTIVEELKTRIVDRGRELYKHYEEEIHKEEKETNIIVNPEEVLSHAGELIDLDVAMYGPEKAIRLNYELSLANEKPLANIIYARDQSNALGDRIIMSNMRWDIRQPEVPIYKEIYQYLGYGDKLVDITQGTLEGGDAMIIDGICYIGVGARTSLEAVEEVTLNIGDHLNEHKITIVAVANEEHAAETLKFTRPAQEHMQVMHLDTFYGPLAHNLSLGLPSELAKREVIALIKNGDHVDKFKFGKFSDFLHEKAETVVIPITEEDQKNYATNSLNDGKGGLIAALKKNKEVKDNIEASGMVRVDTPNIEALVGGYGAVHCMTGSIVRG